jgi:nucleoside-diphosphate-sugar epimerase
MKTCLITGGTGFIGSAITRLMLQKGFQVRILDDNSRGSFRRLTDVVDSLDIRLGDIRDTDLVSKSLKNVDVVIHLAYINGTINFYEKPRDVLDVAIVGMQNVLSGMQANEVKEMYLASSSEVYQYPKIFPTPENVPLVVPDPFNPRYSYGLGKIVQEFLGIHADTFLNRLAIFRPHNIYGPDMGFQHVIPELCVKIFGTENGRVELKGNGSQGRSFCHISDFIQGFEILMGADIKRDIFNIGTREEVSILYLAELIAKSLGKKVEFSSSETPVGETSRRVPDISKIELLGYTQTMELENGISEYCSWYVSNRIQR